MHKTAASNRGLAHFMSKAWRFWSKSLHAPLLSKNCAVLRIADPKPKTTSPRDMY
jgi:hypothetical protein